MTTTGKIMPVKISVLMGEPKSIGKESIPERRRIEPIRIKQLMMSASKSCSRCSGHPTKSFVIRTKGVCRKLYDHSPTPGISSTSECPRKSSSKPTVVAKPSALAQRLPNRQTSRFSAFPASSPARVQVAAAKPRTSIFPSRNLSRSSTLKSITKLPNRKSYLLPPNSIVKHTIEQTKLEPTAEESAENLEKSPNSKENSCETNLVRSTVIITAESAKKCQKSEEIQKNSKNGEEALNIDGETRIETNETCAKLPKTCQTENELETSMENKENIPPRRNAQIEPLKESKSLNLDPVTPEFLQETLKRLEKLEMQVKEIKSTTNKNLKVSERILNFFMSKSDEFVEFLQTKSEEKSSNSNYKAENVVLENFEEIVGKENVNSVEKSRKKSTLSSVERRRSTNLATKQKQSLADDSFIKLEGELNGKSPDKVSKITTPGKKTPIHDQYLRRRSKSERALREYLAIKASTSYLETPDAGKSKLEITPSGKKSLRRSLSRKVFDELQELYSDDCE